MGLVWQWIQVTTVPEEKEARAKLLSAVNTAERIYIESYYQPKREQFLRLYTSKLPNLGVHSTQRGESYHNVVKECLNRQLPLPDAVQRICESIPEIIRQHEERINTERRRFLIYLNKNSFF